MIWNVNFSGDIFNVHSNNPVCSRMRDCVLNPEIQL